ncbi:MAG: SpoVA/SpoVAEb family sporulation membrane protein [Coriobacteriia bacterium]
MIFFKAFVLGGMVCTLFQLVLMVTKIEVPKILIGGMAIGALLTPPGVMDALGVWGGAGVTVMVIGAGSAVEAATEAALGRNWTVAAMVVVIFASLTLLGIAGGAVRVAVKRSSRSAGDERPRSNAELV